MNPFYKFYCRAFQTVFRAALPVLPYRTPQVLNATHELPGLFQRWNVTSVLIVTDKGIRGHGITAPLEALLEENHIHCAVYDDTVANPTTVNVEEARQLYLDHHCQAVIGIGGGSSMDCAKAVGARIAKPKQSLAKMEGILRIHKKLPPVIAIPTTAGTGSETTLAAVITDAETRHKYPINDFPLIPRVAVLDPALTRSLPPFITATTGMDALTHAVEAYIGRSTTKETRRWALDSVSLIFRSLDKAVFSGDDMNARRDMLQAAFLAGAAFSKSYVGYVHALAHALGGKYNTPHGLANAVLLPVVLERYGETAHKKLKDLAIAAGIADESTPAKEAASRFIAAIRDMLKRYSIPTTIQGLNREDIPALAHTASKEANPLYPVPVLMDEAALALLYEPVLEEPEHGENTDSAAGGCPADVLPHRGNPAHSREKGGAA